MKNSKYWYMNTMSGKGKGQQKRVTAIRSAENQTTGNCNKQLLPADRRRTDEPHGRLNKQNPVSPQNNELHESKDGTKQNAGFVCGQWTIDFLYEQYKTKVITRKQYKIMVDKIITKPQMSLRFAG